MRRFSILGAMLLGVPGAALAQEEMAPQPVRIVITKVDCSRLIRHVPAADVAYQPGVDAQGRAVAPADIPGSGADAIPNLVPDVLEFPLLINPVSYGARNKAQKEKAAAQSGADAKLARLSAKGLDNTTMSVGTVRYDMATGIFTFNGEPLGGAEQQELARLCQKQGVR